MFQRNIGNLDRALRVLVGLALLSLIFVGPQSAWGLLGLLPLTSAAVGFCPAYLPLGLNTCGKRGG